MEVIIQKPDKRIGNPIYDKRNYKYHGSRFTIANHEQQQSKNFLIT